jgi:hypothetical protein
MIEVADLPIVDIHVHPFTRKEHLTAEQFTNVTAFGGGSAKYMEEAGVTVDDTVLAWLQQGKRDTIYFRHMMHRMAEFFGCEPEVEQVVAARNSAIASEGYAAYCNRVYRAAGISTLVTDFGYPLPPVPVDDFRADVGIEVVPLYRIEVLIAELLKEDIGWAEFKRRFDDTLSHALTDGGYRGLKSIIAYRTGLDISPLSRTPDQGLQAFDAIRRGIGGGAMKKLRDHLFCRALELCMVHDVPMQVHTGMGDWEVRLTACQPALLMDLLRFPVYRACRVLLVHTGYPYHAEAGYIANVLPNVWCDISEGTPFAGSAAQRIIAEVLEMAPVSRVCYGSDTYGTPEPFYASAQLGRRAVAGALQALVDGSLLSEAEAQHVAKLILSENARILYKLI